MTQAFSNTDTFEEYLERSQANGILDFHLRVIRSPQGRLDFYIHPQSQNGETGDFQVSGSFVTHIPDGLSAGSSRPGGLRLIGSSR